MKRILSMLLCLALVIGLVPVIASAESTTTTVEFKNLGYTNAQEFKSYTTTDGAITIAADKGSNSNTPKYYNTGEAIRVYGGGYLTITPADGVTMTSIIITSDTSNKLTDSDEVEGVTTKTINNTVMTLTPDQSKDFVKVNISGTSGHRRIQKIEVSYTVSGGETPGPDAPACDHATDKLTPDWDENQHWYDCSCGKYTTTPVDHDFTNSNTCVCGFEKPVVPDTPVVGGSYKLVTDASTLKAGDKVIIVAKTADNALSTNQKTSNRGGVAITKVDDTVTVNDDVQILTLENGTVSGWFAFNTGDGYLYASSSSSNQLKTQSSLNENGSWAITIADGTASIIAQGTNSRKYMQYNPNGGDPLYSCYGSASQQALCIYKYEETTGCDGTNHTYVDGTCSCGEVTIKAESATLLYDDMIRVRIKFSIAQEADESGIMIFANSADAEARTNAILTGALVYSNNYYYGYSEGIAAKEMGKSAYYVGYAKYGDTYVYTSVTEYSPKIYAERMLAKEDSSAETKNLCVALMHYGAAAQTYFGSDGALMNTGVAPMDYDANVLGTEKFAVELGEKNGFTAETATMLFEGAITYRFKYSSNADLQGKALYLEYTIDSNTKSVPINDAGYAYITGNAPKDMDQVVVCKPYYLDEDGVTKVYGPSLTYSGYEYSRRIIDKSTNDAMIALAKAFAMYIHYVDIAIAANPA